MAPTIRDFQPPDARRIREIFQTSLASHGLRTDPEGSDTDLDDLDAYYSGGAFRVLADGEHILGMYGLRPDGDGVGELKKMYLYPAEKGKGYGKLMLEDAIRIARELGFGRLTLETNIKLVEAIGLYRSYGFIEAERERFSDQCDCAMALEIL